MRGVVIATVFFLLGMVLAQYVPLQIGERFASSDTAVESVQRIPDGDIAVFPDRVEIFHAGLRYAKVKSNSMAPFITDKSTVFEKIPLSAEEIVVGDVISFYEPSEDAILLHAVVDVAYQEGNIVFQTKGFANDEVDPWLVSFDQVRGVLVGTFR